MTSASHNILGTSMVFGTRHPWLTCDGLLTAKGKMEFWDLHWLFFHKDLRGKKRFYRVILGNISVMWRGKGWLWGLGRDVSRAQTKLREKLAAGSEDGLGTGEHPNTSCEKQPQPQELERALTATSRELRRLQEAEETQPQGLFKPWIPATGLSHAELIDQPLLPCSPSWGYSFSLSPDFRGYLITGASRGHATFAAAKTAWNGSSCSWDNQIPLSKSKHHCLL